MNEPKSPPPPGFVLLGYMREIPLRSIATMCSSLDVFVRYDYDENRWIHRNYLSPHDVDNVFAVHQKRLCSDTGDWTPASYMKYFFPPEVMEQYEIDYMEHSPLESSDRDMEVYPWHLLVRNQDGILHWDATRTFESLVRYAGGEYLLNIHPVGTSHMHPSLLLI